MRTCRYCRHTECLRCRELQINKGSGYCCRCARAGFEVKPQAIVGT
ncbi:MAG: hypothetical protein ACFE9D_05860 [Promethearchaeota archaeon]